MKLEYLKAQLVKVPTSIGEVFFTDKTFVAKDNEKRDYPYVVWDIRGMRGRLSWKNINQQTETVTIKAYILGDYDRRAQGLTQTIEEKWDELREAFRSYLIYQDALDYLSIMNMDNMPYELFDIGLMPDSEIGVSFDVELKLFCNASV